MNICSKEANVVKKRMEKCESEVDDCDDSLSKANYQIRIPPCPFQGKRWSCHPRHRLHLFPSCQPHRASSWGLAAVLLEGMLLVFKCLCLMNAGTPTARPSHSKRQPSVALIKQDPTLPRHAHGTCFTVRLPVTLALWGNLHIVNSPISTGHFAKLTPSRRSWPLVSGFVLESYSSYV